MDNSKTGGNSALVLDLTRSLSPKPGTYNEPRMLTESEIELLRLNKQQLSQQIRPLIKR